MRTRTLNIILSGVFLATVAANFAARKDPSLPNRELIPEMFRTARYNAYSTNPNFQNGTTLQTPVEGTIPRGHPPFHFAATPEEALRAGNTLPAPTIADRESAVERGSKVYADFCQPCHGLVGRGDGLVVARGYPAPPPLDAENARTMKDGQLFHVLTYGQKSMPSYASQISPEDRWNVIAFVRSLQARAASATAGGQR